MEIIHGDISGLINDLAVLVADLRDSSDSSPVGAQSDSDADRIEALFAKHGVTPAGPFVCPFGCGRSYDTPSEAGHCWNAYDHRGVRS